MIEAAPKYSQEAYAILYNKFGEDTFTPKYISWFLSESMVKKLLHVLEGKGWITRVERGKYVCQKPEQIFQGMIEFKVPDLLERSEKDYFFVKMSAVEIWTDFTYIQRSWEHSPYFFAVLEKDLDYWVDYFKEHRIKVFIERPKAVFGEFVVLYPMEKLNFEKYSDKPVQKLDKVVEFCEENIDNFEYPLAYLKEKYDVKTKAEIDDRVLEEVKMVV